MADDYRYSPLPLPAANIPGGDVFGADQYSNIPPNSNEAYAFNTSPPTPPGTGTGGGGSGGGGITTTIDLTLCNGDTARVAGFILPP